ncbi:coiled-coil domain-containing protein 30, partial [Brachybacterium nesterenkovii]
MKSQLRGWLEDKRRKGRSGLETSDWEGAGVHHLGSSNVLTVVQHSSADARLRRALFEYEETNPAGVWTTRMYALSSLASHQSQVIWFESEGRTKSRAPSIPATPNLVRNTLESVAAHDSSVPILPRPQTTRADDVDELLGYITDAGRYISIVVVAPIPDVSNEEWGRAVDSLTRDAIGCASFFVLTPAAHSKLNSALGPAHAIPAGAIRTFVPRVDLSDPTDARRHRLLTARTIVKGLTEKKTFDSRIKHLVSITPRLSLLERELPTELMRTVRVLQREQINATEVVTESNSVVAPAPPAAQPTVLEQPSVVEKQGTATAEDPARVKPYRKSTTHEPWFDSLRTLVRKVLGRERLDERAVQELAQRFEQKDSLVRTATAVAERLQYEREQLEDRLTTLHDQLEAEQLERAVTEADLQDAQKQVRSLERWRATRKDQYEYVPPSIEPWWAAPVVRSGLCVSRRVPF